LAISFKTSNQKQADLFKNRRIMSLQVNGISYLRLKVNGREMEEDVS
jgi:hypothetical protein